MKYISEMFYQDKNNYILKWFNLLSRKLVYLKKNFIMMWDK